MILSSMSCLTFGRIGAGSKCNRNFSTKSRGYYKEGDRYKTIARKTPEETTSASKMAMTMFPTWIFFPTIISCMHIFNK